MVIRVEYVVVGVEFDLIQVYDATDAKELLDELPIDDVRRFAHSPHYGREQVICHLLPVPLEEVGQLIS